jgi:hypothetical protein
MTAWTPKLAALIDTYADCQEAQVKACIDPKRSVASSYAYFCFKSITVRDPTYKKICTELNLPHPTIRATEIENRKIRIENRKRIIELARENNDLVAIDKLERAARLWAKVPNGPPMTITGTLKGIKAAKKNGLKF